MREFDAKRFCLIIIFLLHWTFMTITAVKLVCGDIVDLTDIFPCGAILHVLRKRINIDSIKLFCFINQPFYISPKQKRKCLWSTMSKYWRQVLFITIIVMWNINRKMIVNNGLLSCLMDWWRSKAVNIVGQLIVAVDVVLASWMDFRLMLRSFGHQHC